MDVNEIIPSGPIHGSIRPPGSKSITNRAYVCAALADGASTLTGVLESDDTRVMVECLRGLGARIDVDTSKGSARVWGTAGNLRTGDIELQVGNSGTTMRFLTAVCALGSGRYRLDGNSRMRERPIGDLIDGMQALGVRCHSESGTDCPPVIVAANGIAGGEAIVAGAISSQFLSGLLLAAPYARASVRLVVRNALVSRPYVDMTREVMRLFGAPTVESEWGKFEVPTGGYRAREYAIEPDASAASYFWAAAAITRGSVVVEGLSHASLQGDVRFRDCLKQMGCTVDNTLDGLRVQGGALQGIDVDMSDISDTVQTLAVVALFADGPTTIRGVAHIRHKESDRISDLARELRKLGAQVTELEDGLCIAPRPLRAATLATYDDHRMAMSLSLAGLVVPGLRIENPECVSKTYPGFFADLASLRP